MPKVKDAKTSNSPFYRRKLFWWPIGILLGLIIVGFLAFKLSPWPGTLIIRAVFNDNGQKTLAALEKHKPNTPVTVLSDRQYQPGNSKALLDVYIPQSAETSIQVLPTVIWTHGGAWVSGDKTDAGPYFELLASQGFVVVSLNYTLAPEKKYPAQILELNEAHAYLIENADRFQINPSKIFLAGDSAGSQLSSQMAALITNSDYANEVGVKPALQPWQMSGVALFCGIYDMGGLVEVPHSLPKIISWGDNEVVWAYSGTRDKSDPVIRQMSPYYHVTKDFPATFISGGNADPLTDTQSIPLSSKLKKLGVPVTPLFYPKGHQPALPHEYQFNLDNADGQKALDQLIEFLETRSQ